LSEARKDWSIIDYVKLVPAILIAILIFYFSSLPNPLPPGPPGAPSVIDINLILHMCEFAGLSFFVAHGYFHKFNVKYVILFTIIYAVFDEIHQFFVPNRYFDVVDVFIDIIGVAIGFLVFILLKNLKERINNSRKVAVTEQS
jgi:VanZ family protein